MSRNAVYDAVLALGQAVTPGGAGTALGETGRRLKDPTQCQMPALFQVEPDERVKSHLGQMAKRELGVVWIIYHEAGKDQSATPARYTADLMDRVDAALAAPVFRQSLGGQAYAAFIDGQIRKWEGDDDGITIITVPINILLP